LEQFLAFFRSEALGIVDASGNPVRIKNDGCRHHRARQRTAARLVAASNRPDAALDQRALAPKARRCHGDDTFGQLRLLLCGFVPTHGPDPAQACPAAQPGTRDNSRYSILRTTSLTHQSGRCTRPSSTTSLT